jgi:microcin C transport system ATP-binding protein
VKPILDVRNLTVRFGGTEAVSGVTFTVGQGRDRRAGGRKRIGQIGDGAVDGVAAARIRRLGGSITYDGAEMVGASEADLRAVRGNDISFIFQEPMTSLNPLHTLEKQIAESLVAAPGPQRAEARQRIIELLTSVGIRDPEEPAGRLSPPAIGRAAAARDDRHGACQQPQAPDRGRADDRARRHHPGADPRASGGAEARLGMSLLFITHDLGSCGGSPTGSA